MKKLILLLFLIISNLFATGHLQQGTNYSTPGVKAYAQVRHGPDGAWLLDPYFIPTLTKLQGKLVLDAGCGAAPWSIFMAEHGALVYGIDLQEEMIKIGNKEVKKAGLDSIVTLEVGSVAALSSQDETFDTAISINVGCNLDSNLLKAHIEEMYRTLKPGGMVVLTAPSSFGVTFTSGVVDVDLTLQDLPDNPSFEAITTHLNKLTSVYRATFVERNNRLIHVNNESILTLGEPIWRKLPGLTVPNYYHPESEYLKFFSESGFSVTSIDRPVLSEKIDGLSSSYLGNNPFIIFHLKKD